MNRITETMLYDAVKELAAALGRPYNQHTTVGSLCLQGAYGGWQLQEVVSDGGGINAWTSGFVPKRELYYIVRSMVAGVYLGKKQMRSA